MDFEKKYLDWLNSTYIDEKTKNELIQIKEDKDEIEERFYKDLEFGTGGIRGIIGAGDNRINIYTVAKATQGLANFILKNKIKNKNGVTIAYDSRHMSSEFAKISALVLNNNGIQTYIYPSLRPTPMLSFAVRELNCTAGIVITASHNPPKYNGYKVYWEDGAQVPYPMDMQIINEVNKIKSYEDAKPMDYNKAVEEGLYKVIGQEIDDKFTDEVLGQIINPNIIDKMSNELSIIYTPIHGSGNIPVATALSKAGFKKVEIVKEQQLPDPDFTTVGYPNPEDPKVFELAIKLAKKNSADIIVGTDPDCDRVGVVAKNSKGQYVALNGNMTGVLLTEYILSQKKEQGTLPENGAVLSTIVSTDMTRLIANKYQVEYFETLTGFKNICKKIKEFESSGSNTFLFGFEESYGCLGGNYARDKDAVYATTLICEMAAFYKNKGMTLHDGLTELYKKYGYHKDEIKNVALEGIAGLEKMKEILTNLRQNPIESINGIKVCEFRDYKNKTIKNLITGKVCDTLLDESDVLYYVLEDKSWFCVRPSGTEPKIKIYFGINGESEDIVNEKSDKIISEVMKIIK